MSKTIIWRKIGVSIEFLVESKRDHDELMGKINDLIQHDTCERSRITVATGTTALPEDQ
jgi:hypothetical protein